MRYLRVFAVVVGVVPQIAPASSQAKFDYVIVGGGTCGLVIANRLSADPGVTVAVVEPGLDQRANPNVTTITQWISNQGTDIDWQYQTVPQPAAGNKTLVYHAGKAVGGTSTINGMTYIRGDAPEVDAWEALGNAGWNWATLFPYYKKAQNWTAPTAAQAAAGATFDPALNGRGGPLKVGFLPELDTSSYFGIARDAWDALGYAKIEDVNGGRVRGFDVWPMTVDCEADVREDAARAYYWPVAGRPNLVMIRGTVRSLFWANGTAADGEARKARAAGIEYLDADDRVRRLEVKREVILSAGSLRTPLILELSGVGNPRVLGELGIDTVVELPGVGENLQDQPSLGLAYASTVSATGYVPYATFVTAQDLYGNDTAAVASETRSNLSRWAAHIASRGYGGVDAAAVERILGIQHELIFSQNVTIGEIPTTAYGSTLASAFWALLPFSRGSVHLRSASVEDTNNPRIDPAFFDIDFDLALQIALGRLTQEYYTVPPVRDFVIENTSPGDAVLPSPASDEQWSSFIRSNFGSNSHPVGTASMMARELGGVVDAELRVYGTANVRVVDASVLPLQISGHLTSTLYAVAERAAELIASP